MELLEYLGQLTMLATLIGIFLAWLHDRALKRILAKGNLKQTKTINTSKPMWTGIKDNTEYSAQITPYGNKVNAEIICRDKNKSYYDGRLGLWLTVMNKEFGISFRKEPREIDWINANKWCEEQLAMIERYGTVVVTRPKFLLDLLDHGRASN